MPAIDIIHDEISLNIFCLLYTTFAEHITRPSMIKYIKAKPIISTINKTRLFDSDDTKFAICLLPRGSSIPAISFKASINRISWISGERMVARSKNSPVAPTAFLIRFEETKISPIPSLIYEPSIGIYDLIAYLAVLIDIPSIDPAVIPCIDKKAVNTVKITPISHL